MLQLDYRDHRPLYEQIKEKLKMLIISGVLKPDKKIPSVRELAQELTINPNTIQKAYKELELEGYIYSIRGKGNYVSEGQKDFRISRRDELLKVIRTSAAELMYMGVSEKQIIAIINSIFNEEGGFDE